MIIFTVNNLKPGLALGFLFLIISPSYAKYSRAEWQYGKDTKKNCISTRGEVLIARSMEPVVMNKSKCSVRSGKWADYYYPEFHTMASEVEIDHVVSLKNAHDNGGADWSAAKKRKFANDTTNLVITKKTYNRIKGAHGIDGWLPVHKAYACKYVRDWLKIKKKYSLGITIPERKAADALKGHCH